MSTRERMHSLIDLLSPEDIEIISPVLERLASEEQAEEETDPFYSESNMKYINESIRQIEQGKVIEKTMEELERMANE